jgi:hypothetical protein
MLWRIRSRSGSAWNPFAAAAVSSVARNLDLTGVSFAVSMIRASDVTDGLSSTYLLGEKNVCSDHYTDGMLGGGDEWALAGFDYDTYRFADHDLKPGAIYAIGDNSPLLRPSRTS